MARRWLAFATALLMFGALAPAAGAEEDEVVDPGLLLDPASVVENVALGSMVGELAVSDAVGDHDFALTSGDGDTHNHLFAVEGATIVTAATLDFEALGADLSIRVAATDLSTETVTAEAALSISLEDAGEISLVPADVDENVETGTYIGTLTVGGADPEATYAYSLSAGKGDDHNALFVIEGDALLTAADLDFEELGPSLSVRISVTDQATDIVLHEHSIYVVLNDFEAEMTAAEQEILDALQPSCDPTVEDGFVLWRFPQLDTETRFSYTFGDERDDGERRHRGADLMGATKGAPVVAIADGVISYVGTGAKSGHFVMIQHAEGWETRYMHLNNDTPDTDDGLLTWDEALAPGIVVGAEVLAGQLIGWVGDSGNAEDSPAHTHFELWQRRHLADPFACLRQAWEWQLLAWNIEGQIF